MLDLIIIDIFVDKYDFAVPLKNSYRIRDSLYISVLKHYEEC